MCWLKMAAQFRKCGRRVVQTPVHSLKGWGTRCIAITNGGEGIQSHCFGGARVYEASAIAMCSSLMYSHVLHVGYFSLLFLRRITIGHLHRGEAEGTASESDYINANYVDGYHHEMDFICSQVILPH